MPITPTVYHELARVRVRVEMLKSDLKVAEALAERDYCARAGDPGKNEAERKRNLTIAVDQDPRYHTARAAYYDAVERLATLEADLEIYKDARRDHEWGIRLRLVDALAGRYPAADPMTTDLDAFDGAADEEATIAAADLLDEDARRRAYDEVDELFGPDDEVDTLTPDERGMSGGSLESEWYAGRRRPAPTYGA